MGLGTRKIKVEMTGTGGGRYMRRAEAKAISKKARRVQARAAVENNPYGSCSDCAGCFYCEDEPEGL